MQFKRSTQVAETVKREVSDIISNHLKDPRLGFITVMGVELTDDLRHGSVFVSILGEKDKIQASLDGLESAKGYIRREVCHRLRLRYAPELDFRIDESVAYGDRIDRLINQIAAERDGHGDQ